VTTGGVNQPTTLYILSYPLISLYVHGNNDIAGLSGDNRPDLFTLHQSSGYARLIVGDFQPATSTSSHHCQYNASFWLCSTSSKNFTLLYYQA